MKKKFALIGCGRIGRRHAEQIAKVGKLVAVCDIIPEKALEIAKNYAAKAYFTLENLLKEENNIDVAVICTPNGLHAAQSVECLQAGCHVLCEKPLAISVADCKKMQEASQKAGKSLFVVKQNRYNPPVVFVKDLLDKNVLGKIFSFQINCFWNRPVDYYTDWKGKKESDGGTLFTQFSHFIDLLWWLLGDVATVKAIAKNAAHPAIEFEDNGMVLFEMKNDAIGTLNYTVNSFAKNMEGSFTLFAQNGTVKIGGQYLNELEYFAVKDMQPPVLQKGNPPNGYGFYQGSMSNHDKVYYNLLLALNNAAHPFATADEGIKTVEIIEQIYNS